MGGLDVCYSQIMLVDLVKKCPCSISVNALFISVIPNVIELGIRLDFFTFTGQGFFVRV